MITASIPGVFAKVEATDSSDAVDPGVLVGRIGETLATNTSI